MNKRFLYLSVSFFLISLGFMLLSFSSYKPAKAATTTYASTWTMSQCWRVLLNTTFQGQAWMSLGPGGWTVSMPAISKSGGGTISTMETWTASAPSIQNDGSIIASATSSNGCDVTSVTTAPAPSGQVMGFVRSGAYGYIHTFINGNGQYQVNTGSSIPTVWTISGDITET